MQEQCLIYAVVRQTFAWDFLGRVMIMKGFLSCTQFHVPVLVCEIAKLLEARVLPQDRTP